MNDSCYLFFGALSTSLKAKIISRLREKNLSVEQLSKEMDEERSKVSHALLSLHECGFVNVKREGKYRIYSLNKETLVPLLKLVDRHVKKYCHVCTKLK